MITAINSTKELMQEAHELHDHRFSNAAPDRREGGKHNSYINSTGRSVIPPRFAYAYPFSDGLAAVTESESGESGWGFIDKTGNWVIPPNFEWASNFSEGLAPVNRKQNCAYIDRTGTYVLRPPAPAGEKDCATVWGGFSNGLSRWRFGNKFGWGYMDKTGRYVWPPTRQGPN